MKTLITFVLVGFGAQLVDGTLGMAYGVTSTTLLLAAGYAPAAASAAVHLAEIGTTLASGASHWKFGNVDWPIVLKIGVPGAVGAFAGATFLSSLTTDAAAPWMAGILFLLGAYLLLRFSTKLPTLRLDAPPRKRFLTPLGLFAGFIDATGGGGWGPVATPDPDRQRPHDPAQGDRHRRHRASSSSRWPPASASSSASVARPSSSRRWPACSSVA